MYYYYSLSNGPFDHEDWLTYFTGRTIEEGVGADTSFNRTGQDQ
ncbi:MAG: hypothetical protein AAF843_19570 [Bacteroidota bacterium]